MTIYFTEDHEWVKVDGNGSIMGINDAGNGRVAALRETQLQALKRRENNDYLFHRGL